jgi:hypothetical protein
LFAELLISRFLGKNEDYKWLPSPLRTRKQVTIGWRLTNSVTNWQAMKKLYHAGMIPATSCPGHPLKGFHARPHRVTERLEQTVRSQPAGTENPKFGAPETHLVGGQSWLAVARIRDIDCRTAAEDRCRPATDDRIHVTMKSLLTRSRLDGIASITQPAAETT